MKPLGGLPSPLSITAPSLLQPAVPSVAHALLTPSPTAGPSAPTPPPAGPPGNPGISRLWKPASQCPPQPCAPTRLSEAKGTQHSSETRTHRPALPATCARAPPSQSCGGRAAGSDLLPGPGGEEIRTGAAPALKTSTGQTGDGTWGPGHQRDQTGVARVSTPICDTGLTPGVVCHSYATAGPGCPAALPGEARRHRRESTPRSMRMVDAAPRPGPCTPSLAPGITGEHGVRGHGRLRNEAALLPPAHEDPGQRPSHSPRSEPNHG